MWITRLLVAPSASTQGQLTRICFPLACLPFTLRSSGFLVGKGRESERALAGGQVLRVPHSFMAERFSEGPGAVKAALGAEKRSLDGEDRSATIPPEGVARHP